MVQILNLVAHHILLFPNWSKIYSLYLLVLPSDACLVNRIELMSKMYLLYHNTLILTVRYQD